MGIGVDADNLDPVPFEIIESRLIALTGFAPRCSEGDNLWAFGVLLLTPCQKE